MWLLRRRRRNRLPRIHAVSKESVRRLAGLLSQMYVLLGDRPALSGLRLSAGHSSPVQRTNPARPAIQCDGHHRPALADMGSRAIVAAVPRTAAARIYGDSLQAEWSTGNVHRCGSDGLLDPAKCALPSVRMAGTTPDGLQFLVCCECLRCVLAAYHTIRQDCRFNRFNGKPQASLPGFACACGSPLIENADPGD